MADTSDPRSLPQLVSDLTRDLTTLVKQEAELFRAEISEKLRQVGKGAGEVAAGAICLLAALLVLLQAVVVALAEVIGAGWASLVVGVVVAIIGAILVLFMDEVISKAARCPVIAPRRLRLRPNIDIIVNDARVLAGTRSM